MPTTASGQISLKPTCASQTTAEKASFILGRYNDQIREHREAMTGMDTFNPHSSDVIIATAAKAGTTMLQQITYQILAVTGRIPADPNGEDFTDIGEVVPFVEAAPVVGVYKPRYEFSPRLWKSHAMPDAFPESAKDARYIICIREGVSVSSSWLDFTLEWSTAEYVTDDQLREEILHQFLMQSLLGLAPDADDAVKPQGSQRGNWFDMVKSWLNAKLPNKLVIVYEEMVKNMPATIARVAKFMSVELTEDQLNSVCERCGREVMASNPRFKDHLMVSAVKWPGPGGVRARSLQQAARGFKGCKVRDSFLLPYKKKFLNVFGVEDYDKLLDTIRARPDYAMR